ncbi:MAG: PD-(D/E)XK nuclease family protein [Vicinamibacterales bacterium]
MRVLVSASAAARLEAARRFVLDAPPASEVLVVGASRGAADDLVREIARTRGATFGLYRLSLTQLAARLAAPVLAAERRTPSTALGIEAVAARAVYDATADGDLRYFEPVGRTPGFPRALARTLEELALAGVPPARLATETPGSADLVALLERFDAQFDAVSSVDRAAFFAAATAAVGAEGALFAACRLLLLDVPLAHRAERTFATALARRAPALLATVVEGDHPTVAAWDGQAAIERAAVADTGLDRVRRYLFMPGSAPAGDPLPAVELFSAPGEGREALEIARRILREARNGVPFDRMAIALRAPRQYAGLLEHALERASVPAHVERGARRPHPAGRAFLAILRCRLENLSARRFAEYLSLGQVPQDGQVGPAGQAERPDVYPASQDDVFGSIAERADVQAEADADDAHAREAPRAFRAPWRWERILAESRVVNTASRWEQRLSGLMEECDVQVRELTRTEPDSGRLAQLRRKTEDLRTLAAFALPLVRTLEAWPTTARWSEWLDLFEALAPVVLQRPGGVLRVLGDLRPMGAIGPVGLDETVRVLTARLGTIESTPKARRYGQVFVGTPEQLRGRVFDVVFVPALAERLFPQRPREDPLLLDEARRVVDAGLATQQTRAEDEQLQLRLAIGAARSRVYVSFPTIETGEGRPRVPSLYALEVWRAMTGRVPGADELQHAAARVSKATLAWPAPDESREAIDALEHDLSVLRRLVDEPDSTARGRAQYMLQLNEHLARSVRERYARPRKAWSKYDGLVQANDRTRPLLAPHRLGTRVYSLSALQRYAACPYQFLLGAIYRLRPAEDLEPLQRLDPLTKGSLFHAVQTAFYRRLKEEGRLPVTPDGLAHALDTLDECLARVAGAERARLAPAIDRVWDDEVAGLRRDLRLWVDQIAHADDGWVPVKFEWAFGLKGSAVDVDRDPDSRPEPVSIDGRFLLHGSVDLVEEHATRRTLRVTDHKTGRARVKDGYIIDGGRHLQPVLYSLAVEAALGRPVEAGRLYYATTDGGFTSVPVALGDDARRTGLEALEIIDRAIETGFLAPAPAEGACTWCDFRPVCGSSLEKRNRRKAAEPLADLDVLRGRK